MAFYMLGITIIPENSASGLLTNTACKISTNVIQPFLFKKNRVGTQTNRSHASWANKILTPKIIKSHTPLPTFLATNLFILVSERNVPA